MIKKIISLILVIIMVESGSMSVYASKSDVTIHGIDCCNVSSENNYYGYELEWSADEGYIWDILKSVSYEGVNIASYSYNEKYLRICKTNNGVEERYTYYEDGRLKTVENQFGVLEYFYVLNNSETEYYVDGFIYDNEKYTFIKKNSIITAIEKDGKLIAEYIYDENGSFLGTINCMISSKYCTDDQLFVGNINKVRLNGSVYDEETGWYYKGRYFDAKNERYVDGISFEQFIKISERCNNEQTIRDCLLKVYSLGTYSTYGSTKTKSSTVNATYTEALDTVSRTIYAEAGTDSNDWDAVAAVIYNRMINSDTSSYGGPTAYGVVTHPGQFAAYMNCTDLFLFPDTTSERWSRSAYNAWYLVVNNNDVPSRGGVGNQLYFLSVGTFLDSNYVFIAPSTMMRGDKRIVNVMVPTLGLVGAVGATGTTMYNNVYAQAGKCNVYFNYLSVLSGE